MTPIVECLSCGEQHRLYRTSLRRIMDAECPRCGYLGWAYHGELSEASRRAFRAQSPEHRRFELVA